MDCNRIIKNLIIALTSLILISSCGLFNRVKVKESDNEAYDVMYARSMYITDVQLDSICVADTLDNNLNNWYTSYFVDYPTNTTITKKLYIKTSGNKQILYILTLYDEKYKIVIRTEEDNE